MLNKKRLTILTILVSVTIAFIGSIIYWSQEKNIRTEKEIDLSTIAQLKIDQLEQWVRERNADISVLASSKFFTNSINQLLHSNEDLQLQDYLKERISIPRIEYNYRAIFIVSPENTVLLSSKNKPKHIDLTLQKKIEEAIFTKEIIHTDFYYCEEEKMIHYDIIAPIFNDQNKYISSLVLRTDPSKYLFPLIQTWPTPSKTSETLLIKKEGDHVLFLNELRHQTGTALNLTIPLQQKTLPAVMAADGTKGIVSGIDYRGKEVVAYVSPVPETEWYMVSKIDRAELFQEIVSQGKLVLFSTALIIIIIGITIALFYNLKQKNTYRSLYETEEEYKTTLYSIGDAVITTDHEGRVKQINKIAEELTGWCEIDGKGQKLSNVFNIINEDTRNIVENPVDKVFKKGTIVGLANHTLLISKNGKETPIADSAAPIRDADGEIIGVVLVFRDQSDEKRHFEEIKASLDFAEGIIQTLHESLLVLDEKLRIVSANNTFLKTFGFKKEEVEGYELFSIGDHAWANENLRDLLEKVLPQNTQYNDFEITFNFENIGTCVLNMNVRRIYANDKKTKNILLAINDITEKNKLIEELIISKEKAEESNNLKTAFLANMSHEIRTPLNGILGFSSIINDNELTPEIKKHYTSIIEESGQRLLNIVNDILDVSLIQSNQLKIKPSKVYIRKFLEELFAFYSTLMKEKANKVEFNCDLKSENQNLTINTDKSRLFQIFKNLLDNSFKFTNEGQIHFGGVQVDHKVQFFVKDTGPGIPQNQHTHIFEKFQQVESIRGEHSEGTGLGLAIAKGLVEQMGGKMWVESELGDGAQFFFTLPLN